MSEKKAAVAKPKKKSAFFRNGWDAYIWMAPSLLLILLFIFIPVILTFYLAFSEVSTAGLVRKFGTLDNFKFIFGEVVFKRVMLNTLIWDIVIVSLSMVLSIIVALVLNEKFKGRKFVRTVLLLPWATSGLITSSVWKYIFDYNYGALNTLLMKIGLISQPIN